MNSCPLCLVTVPQTYKESHTDSGITYKLHECSTCRAQYWLPLQNPGSEWYERDERYAGANNDPTLTPNWNHRKIISYLKPKTGRVFDVGCGTGNFLAWAAHEGWEVAGIDFDRNAVHASQTVFKLPNIEVNSLGEFHQQHVQDSNKFDLITFFDVFEHIDNHVEFTKMVRELLVPGGHIAMSMPYRGSASWLQPNDLPPRHLTRWDRSSLTDFFKRNGFTVVYCKRVPASFTLILMKLRFKYGKFFSFNMVNKVKAAQPTQAAVVAAAPKETFKVSLVRALARIKDLVLFGIPAAIIWVGLLFTSKRYNGLFAIAQKN